MIKKEFIGSKMTARAKNGCLITVVIEDDKSKYKLYKNLGLDVFVDKKKNGSGEGND